MGTASFRRVHRARRRLTGPCRPRNSLEMCRSRCASLSARARPPFPCRSSNTQNYLIIGRLFVAISQSESLYLTILQGTSSLPSTGRLSSYHVRCGPISNVHAANPVLAWAPSEASRDAPASWAEVFMVVPTLPALHSVGDRPLPMTAVTTPFPLLVPSSRGLRSLPRVTGLSFAFRPHLSRPLSLLFDHNLKFSRRHRGGPT